VPLLWERFSGISPLWLIPVVILLAGAGGVMLFAARKKTAAGNDRAEQIAEQHPDQETKHG
jgi:cytochrome c-type biogenesis protein CcmH/NrfF